MIALASVVCSLFLQLASAQNNYASVLAEQLNQYCTVHGGRSEEVSTNLVSAQRVGKAGPRGPPGSPGLRGMPGVVNYTKIREMIFEVLSEVNIHDCTGVSGVTKVFTKYYPRGTMVYCDARTDGGGWTVFQRRQDGSVNFYRSWTDYVDGFGDLEGEYWMGLEKLHRLTSNGNYELRVDLGDWEGNTAYAKYSTFAIADSSANYRLSGGGYSGTAGDGMSGDSNNQFSTRDRDNDVRAESCSQMNQGAWWFRDCYDAHLNGVYYNQIDGSHVPWKGIVWDEWRGERYSLKFTEMKFKRKQD